MTTMQAYRLVGGSEGAAFAEVPVPAPGPGEVLVEVAGVGLCHSDLVLLDAPAAALPFPVPFTLGHEIAGRVAAWGPGVAGLREGAAVLVACVRSCGSCRYCVRGADNYCVEGWHGRGYGLDGGLARYVVAGRRDLVDAEGLDPRVAAPLTDAGATSYHAVRRVLARARPGSAVVVIGVGGLGSFAVQWLRLLGGVHVVAVDRDEQRLATARELGAAAAVPAGEDAAQRLADCLGGERAEGVLDFVGTDETARLALGCAAPLGAVALVGAGGGAARVRYGVPFDCDVFVPRGAPLRELREVVELARRAGVRIDVEHVPFERTPQAYERFRAGTLGGRAVVLPAG